MKINTKNLIQLLKKADEDAFSYLVDKYHQRLFAYAISLSGDYSMAKDIVQEVFIKTYEFRKKLDPNYSIDGFLYRSVYNQFINSYHKNKSLLKIHDEYVKYLNQIINESSESDFDRLIRLIDKSINKLPKKCKEIFKLSKTEGLTNYEIATSLNISVKTVEAQITIAFKKIKADIL